MNNHLIILGIVVLLLAVGLSGCVQRKTPVSEGNVIFSIEDVIVTSELEIKEYWTNETKIEVSNDSKFVIISIKIENKENKWLDVLASFEGLTDDKGNKYEAEMFVRLNNSIYTVEQIASIDENETLSKDISPNSTEVKKVVFTISLDREPERLELIYGFKANELTNVEDWFDIELQLPS